MLIRFTKMHGLGNDFMVVDGITQQPVFTRENVPRLADRHRGVGFDQLLVAEPPRSPDADFLYRIYNPDGSEAGQCGNGARCLTRFVRDQGLSIKPELVLETGTTRMTARMREDGQVEVDMGEPSFDPAAVPLDAGPQADEYTIDVPDAGPVSFAAVSVGNPHAVLWVRDVFDADVERLGPALQTHPAFPESVNVGFCQVVDPGFVRLRVFERGVGETQACGSGACAAVAAGIRTGRLGPRVKVSLPGGKLRIGWRGPGCSLKMTGEACRVFEGEVEL